LYSHQVQGSKDPRKETARRIKECSYGHLKSQKDQNGGNGSIKSLKGQARSMAVIREK